MAHIAVVGGGIAGLSTAYHLRTRHPAHDVTLVEASSRIGGKILTENVDGFIVEAGPDSFLTSKPGALELCLELGLEDQLVGRDERQRASFVRRADRLYPLPEGMTGLIPARMGSVLQSALLSRRGKLRMLGDLLPRPTKINDDESLASFVTRHLGREAYARLVEPLMAGIYAGDGEQLSLAATFPQLRQLERDHGSLMRGIRAQQRKQKSSHGKQWPTFVAPRDGMGEIVRALQSRLQRAEVVVDCPVKGISVSRGSYSMETGEGPVRADSIVLAVPPYVAEALLRSLDPNLAACLRAIPHVSSATVSIGFRETDLSHLPHGYGYVVPRDQAEAVLACTWSSNKFANRAPAGGFLTRTFFGRAGREDVTKWSDSELLERAKDEMRKGTSIRAQPVLTRVHRWPRAMPQYNLGHLDRVRAIEERLDAHPGLFLAGNGYRGVGLPDCVRSGEAACEEAVSYLEGKEKPGS